MTTELGVVPITNAIQLAVAPVFLLAGIGAILNVLATRLARIVDRSRELHARRENVKAETQLQIDWELDILVKRGRVVHRAIGFATVAALLVCLVIAILFISAVADWHSGMVGAALGLGLVRSGGGARIWWA